MRKLGWTAFGAGYALIVWAATASSPSQQFKTIANLDADTSGPRSPLVQVAGGGLLGTATLAGHGSVFATSPSGNLRTLLALDSPIGSFPASGIIQGTDGNFYGTAVFGGANGFGSIYKVTAGGTATTLYSFCPHSPCVDGEQPYGALLQASDGNFYGSTLAGGHSGNGTVFRISSSGAFATLYKFNGSDGKGPSGTLIQATDGDLYGTTGGGGEFDIGTAFKITTTGALTTLHSFTSTEGIGPHAGLVQGTDGIFYGTVSFGGGTGCGGSGCGVVFAMTPEGAVTILHDFQGTNGSDPETPLIESEFGLYGTTLAGGAENVGTVFRVTRTGNFTVLHSFCSDSDCLDGKVPYGLVQDTNGRVYGTTFQGGVGNNGTIYVLSLGLSPFIKTSPRAGTIGSNVVIVGTNLSGTTSVTFDGTPATFIVISPASIRTTVPFGAATGIIKVLTPHGEISTHVPFQVLP